MEKEQELGSVRAEVDAVQIGQEILSVVLGLEVQWLMDPGHVDYAAAMEAYIDRLVDQISVEER